MYWPERLTTQRCAPEKALCKVSSRSSGIPRQPPSPGQWPQYNFEGVAGTGGTVGAGWRICAGIYAVSFLYGGICGSRYCGIGDRAETVYTGLPPVW